MKNIILVLVFFVLVSCFNDIKTEKIVYYESKDILESWNKDSAYVFSFSIEDTSITYNLYIELRNNNQYPFSNIFLFSKIEYFNTEIEKKELYREDILQYIMASPDGRWLGTGITNIKKSIFLYDTNIKFKNKDIYKIYILQGMRVDKLEGLESISLILEKNI